MTKRSKNKKSKITEPAQVIADVAVEASEVLDDELNYEPNIEHGDPTFEKGNPPITSDWDVKFSSDKPEKVEFDRTYEDNLIDGVNYQIDIVKNTFSAIARWWKPANWVSVGQHEEAVAAVEAGQEELGVFDLDEPMVYPRVARRYAQQARIFLNIIDDNLAMRAVVKEWIVKQMTLNDVRKCDIAKLLPLAVEFSFMLTPYEVEAMKMTLTQSYRDQIFRRDHGLYTREAPTLWNWLGRKTYTMPTAGH